MTTNVTREHFNAKILSRWHNDAPAVEGDVCRSPLAAASEATRL